MTTRFGRYETVRAIAAGGMATVYLARVVGLAGFQRQVALKVMHPQLVGDAEFEAMFLDEARLGARIHHLNVVATLDVQKAPEGLFLVMEYIEGPSLHRVLDTLAMRGERLPLGVALRVAIEVLSGLHAAHTLRGADGMPLQVVHRDVSPQNVLLGLDGVCRLTDFGVARATARLATTKGGQLKGKVSYMAPEQLQGTPADHRADIYAAAVVLWECLAGRRLFQADNEAALLQRILDGPAASPHAVQPSVPEPISALCMRALERDRDLRPDSAAALADALEEAAAACGIELPIARSVSRYLRLTHAALLAPSTAAAEPGEPTMVTPISSRVVPKGDASALSARFDGPGEVAPLPEASSPGSGAFGDVPTKTSLAPAASTASVVAATASHPGDPGGARAPRSRRTWLAAALLAGVLGVLALASLGAASGRVAAERATGGAAAAQPVVATRPPASPGDVGGAPATVAVDTSAPASTMEPALPLASGAGAAALPRRADAPPSSASTARQVPASPTSFAPTEL